MVVNQENIFHSIKYIKVMVTTWMYNLRNQNEPYKRTPRHHKETLGLPNNGSPHFLFLQQMLTPFSPFLNSQHSLFSNQKQPTLYFFFLCSPENHTLNPSPFLQELPTLDTKTTLSLLSNGQTKAPFFLFFYRWIFANPFSFLFMAIYSHTWRAWLLYMTGSSMEGAWVHGQQRDNW